MNKHKQPEHSIHTAHSMVEVLTGATLKEEDFRDFSHYAMMLIGYNHIPIKMKHKVSSKGVIAIEDELVGVDAVADDDRPYNTWEVAEYSEGVVHYSRLGYSHTDNSLSKRSGLGAYINFNFYPPSKIKVAESLAGEVVYVLAKMVLRDGEGDALLNHKQVIAVARHCIYLSATKKSYMGIKSVIPLAQLKDEAGVAIADAKVPERITDNELDDVLNVKVSFGRKSYNKDMFIK
jgi:hypothetical protein